MKKLIIFIVAFVILPVCAYAKKAPDWIDGASKKYPEPRYFIGVGAVALDKGGPKQQMTWAADRARAEIAKTLRIQVRSTTVAQRTVVSETKGKPKTQSTQTDVVTASANEILEGVEIKEYYRDKKGKMIYALVILDRPIAADGIQKKVDALKEELSNEMDEGKGYQDKNDILLSIRHYNVALGLADEINDKNELISVLNPIGETQTNFATDIKKILGGLARLVQFEVKVEGPAASVRPYIIQGLSEGGFITKSEGATYQLTGTSDINYKGEMDMGPDLKVQVYQADLDLEIKNPKTNETIGALTWSVSANEKTAGMAEKSAIRALGRHVQKTIADKILSAF